MTIRFLRHPILILLVLALFLTGYHLHRHDHHHDDGCAHCPLCLLKANGFILAALFALSFRAATHLHVLSPERDSIAHLSSFRCHPRAPPCAVTAF